MKSISISFHGNITVKLGVKVQERFVSIFRPAIHNLSREKVCITLSACTGGIVVRLHARVVMALAVVRTA
jgi:hypothetical protein